MSAPTSPSIPNMPSMEMLLAEGDINVSAGLPHGLRQDLDTLNALRERVERGKAEREKMERLVAAINEHTAKIAELQKELADAVRAYGDAMKHRTPAA
jgi:hypothetical protein